MIKQIPYLKNIPNQNVQNLYGGNIITNKGDEVGIKQVNIIQNNYKGIFKPHIPHQKGSKKHLSINHLSTKTNETINLSSVKDKSKDILCERQIITFKTFKTLKNKDFHISNS